ncbi:transcription regulator () [Lactiplantibacillus plantarum]|nr:transcription regulator () [Lactiplantibacillus plantarum]
MKQTQLLKGVLDGCVLAIIADHEIYGYELIQALREDGFDSIVGGTLYPYLQNWKIAAISLGNSKLLLMVPSENTMPSPLKVYKH